ncbi:F-box/kelch-repeat protein At1g15670-like [Carica papaya]|uniref:F-box/kelch-repeat protein At1g15670-like n=1 Tax=Carica papaya TaxID=3649 RepID=UPI000B8CD98A|nr:F-box/kelch-repeat protein At1g15670-like [Carica papaya]
MDLIPDLPNDIVRDCLIRLPYKQFPAISSVCKGWRLELQLPEFFRRRKATSHSQNLFVMSQARVDPNRKPGAAKRYTTPVYRVTVLEPETGEWCELPPAPGLSNGFPLFCQFAAVGLDVVVMGGLDPETWETSNSVFIFNFASAKWRRGADMPGVRRLLFGCASDLDGTVYVAGGHDGDKNALRSAMKYDVAEDRWSFLPDMARERDECKAIFQRGKLQVIGGYRTDRQGQFEGDAEAFDVSTWQWDAVHDTFLKAGTCPRSCVGSGEELYMCCGDDVVSQKGSTWQSVGKVPAEVCNVAYVESWKEDKVVVIGCARFGEGHKTFVFDLKSLRWTEVKEDDEFSGHVQAGCHMEI